MVHRLIADHDSTAEQMRKPFTFKDAMSLHQAGGCFLHFLAILKKMSPASSFDDARAKLEDQFMKGFMDADLLHVLSSSVPPADIKSIGSFRTAKPKILFYRIVGVILAPCNLLLSWENIRNSASFVSIGGRSSRRSKLPSKLKGTRRRQSWPEISAKRTLSLLLPRLRATSICWIVLWSPMKRRPRNTRWT